jgi:hypothetical protein
MREKQADDISAMIIDCKERYDNQVHQNDELAKEM